MHKLESILEDETHKFFYYFLDTNGSPKASQKTRSGCDIQKEEKLSTSGLHRPSRSQSRYK